MRLFISWSGQMGKSVAEGLRNWLPSVIQAIDPWMSAQDIHTGAQWSGEIVGALETAGYGIVCVTPENTGSPWLNFEAGALKKTLESKVSPYLFRIQTTEIPRDYPLTIFQGAMADQGGTLQLLRSVNEALGKEGAALTEKALESSFDKWWPDLKAKLDAIPTASRDAQSPRDPEDMILEILALVREFSNRERSPSLSARSAGNLFDTMLVFPHVVSLGNMETEIVIVNRSGDLVFGAGTSRSGSATLTFYPISEGVPRGNSQWTTGTIHPGMAETINLSSSSMSGCAGHILAFCRFPASGYARLFEKLDTGGLRVLSIYTAERLSENEAHPPMRQA